MILIGENLDPGSSTIGLFMYAMADLLKYKNQDWQTLQLVDSTPLFLGYHPLPDDVLLKKVGIYIKRHEYKVAAGLRHYITTDYQDEATANRALFRQAGLRENEINDPITAMELDARLLEQYPWHLFYRRQEEVQEASGDLGSIMN